MARETRTAYNTPLLITSFWNYFRGCLFNPWQLKRGNRNLSTSNAVGDVSMKPFKLKITLECSQGTFASKISLAYSQSIPPRRPLFSWQVFQYQKRCKGQASEIISRTCFIRNSFLFIFREKFTHAEGISEGAKKNKKHQHWDKKNWIFLYFY